MARPAQLTVLSTISAREALREIAPLFERQRGVTVTLTFGGGPSLSDEIRSGLAGDLFVGPDAFNDPLIAEGKLVSGTRVPFARSRSAVAVRAGAPKPDIGTAETFKQALLAAKSVCYTRGASGIQVVEALERLGIAEAIAAKLVRPDSGELVGALVARGGAEIGVQQVSELLAVSGIEIVGPLPDALETPIVYAVTVMPRSTQGEAGQDFVRFMRSEEARAILVKKGLEPI